MSLSKVWFPLFCVAFKELTAHLRAEICSWARSKAPAPQRWLHLTGAKGRKEHRKPLEPHQSESCFPSVQAFTWSIPCFTCSNLGRPLIEKFGTVSSIPWELIFALQLLSQWVIVPFGDMIKCAVFLELWVYVYPLKNTRTKGKYLRAFWPHVPG